MRAVVEAAGIRDILSKIQGTTNPVNVVRATIEALAQPALGRGDRRRGAASTLRSRHRRPAGRGRQAEVRRGR